MVILYALAALATPTVSLEGSCPGRVEIVLDGITPTANFVVFASAERGSDPVLSGRCEGYDSRLTEPRSFGPFDERDGDGGHVIREIFASRSCGLSFTVLDLATCEVSAPRTFGDPGVVILDSYDGAGQTVHRLEARELPPGDAAIWYQEICEDAGMRPVSCDPARWGDTYDAAAWNAVVLDADHYSCNVSSGINGLAGWDHSLTYHRPLYDDRGVCEQGCTISGLPVHPICTDTW